MSQWIVEAQMDMRALLRSPSFYIPAFAFPVVFYFFFGIMVDFSNGQGLPAMECEPSYKKI